LGVGHEVLQGEEERRRCWGKQSPNLLLSLFKSKARDPLGKPRREARFRHTSPELLHPGGTADPEKEREKREGVDEALPIHPIRNSSRRAHDGEPEMEAL
jgi:hypothetical protein